MTKLKGEIFATGLTIIFVCFCYWFIISFIQIMNLQAANLDYFPQWNLFVFLLNLFAGVK